MPDFKNVVCAAYSFSIVTEVRFLNLIVSGYQESAIIIHGDINNLKDRK